MTIHEEILPEPTRSLFDVLSRYPWISDFYLAGGTGLALQLGHRTSVDLDFFNEKQLTESELMSQLSALGELEVLSKSAESITCILNKVKLSFLGYHYPMLRSGSVWKG